MLNIAKLLWTQLNKLGIPVAYGRFADDEEVHLPFIIYNFDKRIIDSEGDIYLYDYRVNIEYYYSFKDIETEEMLRSIIHEIKPVANFEESILSNYIMTRITFNLIQSEDLNNDNNEQQ